MRRRSRPTGGSAGAQLDELVHAVLDHPRYRGGYLPVWRILDAAALPLKPAAIRRSLEHLEAQGRVERRRACADQVEWRIARRGGPPPGDP